MVQGRHSSWTGTGMMLQLQQCFPGLVLLSTGGTATTGIAHSAAASLAALSTPCTASAGQHCDLLAGIRAGTALASKALAAVARNSSAGIATGFATIVHVPGDNTAELSSVSQLQSAIHRQHLSSAVCWQLTLSWQHPMSAVLQQPLLQLAWHNMALHMQHRLLFHQQLSSLMTHSTSCFCY